MQAANAAQFGMLCLTRCLAFHSPLCPQMHQRAFEPARFYYEAEEAERLAELRLEEEVSTASAWETCDAACVECDVASQSVRDWLI